MRGTRNGLGASAVAHTMLLAALCGCGDDGGPAPGDDTQTPIAGGGPVNVDPSGMGPDSPQPMTVQPTGPDPMTPMAPTPQSQGPMAGGGIQVCYDLCQAQQTAEEAGNCVRLGLETCKGICDAAEGGGCWERLVALNSCQLTGEFSCGFFSAESDADCDTELQAYNRCFGL